MPKAVYIHIPFCNRICPYCDFNKYVLKGQPVEQYLAALDREIELTLQLCPTPGIETIFVGGGTPTVLTAVQLERFLQSIKRHVSFSNLAEFTFEANPETMDLDKLQVLKEQGVNRLSFGVQTFDPQLLRRLGRMHSPEDVFQAIAQAQEQGFQNISIDLMFGLPNQTVEMFNETLNIAFKLGVQHFSAYSLKVEEGTFFHTLYQKDKLPLPSEDEETQMYAILLERMELEGFKQYEISNFAQPGFESRHNLTYWRNGEYYGFGAGAHGYVQGVRHVNAAGVDEYTSFLQQGQLPHVETHPVSTREAMEDMMIMGLRTREGVALERFYHNFHCQLEDVYEAQLIKLVEKNLIEKTAQGYRLTKSGMFLGNEVFAEFLTID